MEKEFDKQTLFESLKQDEKEFLENLEKNIEENLIKPERKKP